MFKWTGCCVCNLEAEELCWVRGYKLISCWAVLSEFDKKGQKYQILKLALFGSSEKLKFELPRIEAISGNWVGGYRNIWTNMLFHQNWNDWKQNYLYQRDCFDRLRPVGGSGVGCGAREVFRRRTARAVLHWIGSIQGSSIMQVRGLRGGRVLCSGCD